MPDIANENDAPGPDLSPREFFTYERLKRHQTKKGMARRVLNALAFESELFAENKVVSIETFIEYYSEDILILVPRIGADGLELIKRTLDAAGYYLKPKP